MESDSKQPTYVLVDGSSYLFRAYYALPDLRNSKGEATGAIRGVISMIKKLEKDFPESLVVVVFDAPGRTFRDDLYEDYKANRSSTPDDLKEQIQPIKDLVVAMGFPLICMEGVEADDVIGTYALLASKAGQTVIISTGDKDMAQLVNQSVTLVNTMTETMMDRDGVIEKFAVPPELIIDYLALMGDTVDNIPGVPKVGPKTAAKWLNEFGSLESLIDRAAEIKGKVGENLRNSLEQLPLSKALTTIKTDVEVPISLKDLKRDPADRDLLLKEFGRLEFKGWLAELEGDQIEGENAQPPQAIDEKSYELITSIERLEEWVNRLSSVTFFAIDTETTSIDYMSAKLVGVSFAVGVGDDDEGTGAAEDAVNVVEVEVLIGRIAEGARPVVDDGEAVDHHPGGDGAVAGGGGARPGRGRGAGGRRGASAGGGERGRAAPRVGGGAAGAASRGGAGGGAGGGRPQEARGGGTQAARGRREGRRRQRQNRHRRIARSLLDERGGTHEDPRPR